MFETLPEGRPARRRTVTRAALAALLVASAATLGATRTEAAPPTADPVVAGQYGAHYLTSRVNASGFVPTVSNTPNYGLTLGAAVALAQAGVEKPTFDRIVAYLQANIEATITNGGAGDNAGNLGYLLMITKAAGLDATSFGGVDLLARLDGTLGAFEPGLYGAADPTYDGVFRQSLAILGILSVGGPQPTTALNWLQSQMCSAPAASQGAFQSYRANPATTDCKVFAEPPDFVAPDTNSTALAIQALYAGGAGLPGYQAPLQWLTTQQTADGGFGYQSSPDPDPNSTAMVIQAIVAVGEEPTAGRWTKGPLNPYTSLLEWQLGCSAAEADRGAFASPFSSGFPDDLATVQAVWGAGGRPFPVSAATVFGASVDPCAPPTTTTSSSSTSSTSSSTTTSTVASTTTTAVIAAPPATPVAVSPNFAG